MTDEQKSPLTAEQVLYKVTVGTDIFRDRDNPKKIRLRHLTPTYALVQWVGSSYRANGFTTYVNGRLELVRLPQDAKLLGGREIWEVTRRNTITPKRLAKIIEVVSRYALPDNDDAYRAVVREIKEVLEEFREPEE